MRKCISLSALTFLVFTVVSSNSFAQNVRADSSSQTNAFNNALTLFYVSIGEQSPIYNGAEYYFYDPLIKGNAYFLDVNAFTPGTILYDRTLYHDVPMLYDVFSDKVVVLLYNHFSKISLVKEKVQSFEFLNHRFVNISADSLNNNSIIKSGFYDELYSGKSQVLCKRSKNIQTNSSVSINESYFTPAKDYFFRKNNIYYSITSQGSMLNVLKDKKKELQQYIRANQIKFRKTPEEAMVKIASYYDHLIN
jgi:hypothetical protein